MQRFFPIILSSPKINLIAKWILGVITISATLGAATGPVLTGRIFDVTGSYDLAFTLHIVAFSAAGVAVYFLRRPKTAP